MKTSEKIKMYQDIESHGENLKAIFNINGIDPIALCKKVRRLEKRAENTALDHCNGFIDMDEAESKKAKILKSLDKILNFEKQGIPVFINGDPRGYALKIDDEFIRAYRDTGKNIHTDWGGYGIIAPEFDGK